MKFISLHIVDSLAKGFYEFSDITIIHSQHNQRGKTSLIRCLLYALGYSIPSPQGFNLDLCSFTLKGEKEDSSLFILKREGNHIELIEGNCSSTFTLPLEQDELHSRIFGLDKPLILINLLGAFYFDQEKGWTLLNRGTVIGGIKFRIEDFILGFTEDSVAEERRELECVTREIDKYTHLLEYAKNLPRQQTSDESFADENSIEILNFKLQELNHNRVILENELNRLRSVMRGNTTFINFISSMNLRVRGENGTSIPVTKDTLLDFSFIQEFVKEKKNEAQRELDKVKNSIKNMEEALLRKECLINLESDLDMILEKRSRIKIDKFLVDNILVHLKKRKQTLSKKVRRNPLEESLIRQKLNNIICSYLTEFGVEAKYHRDVLTTELKTLSGAVFHIMVFIFKLAYVRILREEVGCRLPIVIDSPNGREVEMCHIEKMKELLLRDFSMHQIIVATIYNPDFNGQKMINMQGSVTTLGE